MKLNKNNINILKYLSMVDTQDVSLEKHNARYHKNGEIKNCKYRTPLVLSKVGKWLIGVSADAVKKSIDAVVSAGIHDGWIILRTPEEAEQIKSSAFDFWLNFHDNVIMLSDARCVYFTPDERSLRRGVTNTAAWAEYSVHAVTSGGKKMANRDYNSRSYNHHKVNNLDVIEKTVKEEKCFVELHPNSEFDSVNFKGETHEGNKFEVITRLDDAGNMYADLSEVTFEASRKKWKKQPRLMPLTEAIQTVVHHQAADTLP